MRTKRLIALMLATPLLSPCAAGAARPIFGMAPLCRDSKGIARPCPPHQANIGLLPRDRSSGPGPQARRKLAGGSEGHVTASAVRGGEAGSRPARRPLFGMGKLCRDSKGTAKPCG